MSNHAFLSPSGSHMWLNCTPSAMLESEFPGGTSSAAEEGTAAYATDAAVNHGKEWKGFKVVEGRSVRKYKDEEMVAQAAKDHGFTDIYCHSLITMTDMQKLMGKKQFETILGNRIVKHKGRPTLVPITDKRPAINVATANNEFKQED